MGWLQGRRRRAAVEGAVEWATTFDSSELWRQPACGVLGDVARLNVECMDVRTLADDGEVGLRPRSLAKAATSGSGAAKASSELCCGNRW
jgi:hypothetical protein